MRWGMNLTLKKHCVGGGEAAGGAPGGEGEVRQKLAVVRGHMSTRKARCHQSWGGGMATVVRWKLPSGVS